MRETKKYYSLPYNPKLRERAKALRRAENLSEVLIWRQLTKRKFKGFDFDRQKIIGNYIVDFYCVDCGVVVEIDGSSHDHKEEYDAYRDAYLEGLGLTVIHVRASDVLRNFDDVMFALYNHPALQSQSQGQKCGALPRTPNHPVRFAATPPRRGIDVNFNNNVKT